MVTVGILGSEGFLEFQKPGVGYFTPRSYWLQAGETVDVVVDTGEAQAEDRQVYYSVIEAGTPWFSIEKGPLVVPAGSRYGTITFKAGCPTHWEPSKRVVVGIRAGGKYRFFTFRILFPTDNVPLVEGSPVSVDPGETVRVHFTMDRAVGYDVTCPLTEGGTSADHTLSSSTITFPAGITEAYVDVTYPPGARRGTTLFITPDLPPKEPRRNLLVDSAVGEFSWDEKKSIQLGEGLELKESFRPTSWISGCDNTGMNTGQSLEFERDGTLGPTGLPAYKYTTNPNAGTLGCLLFPFEQDTVGYPWDKIEDCNWAPVGEYTVFSAHFKPLPGTVGSAVTLLDRNIQGALGTEASTRRVSVDWTSMTLSEHNLDPVLDSWGIQDVGDGWYRLYVSVRSRGDEQGHIMQTIISPAFGNIVADGAGSYVANAQVEHTTKPYPSAYQEIVGPQHVGFRGAWRGEPGTVQVELT